MTSEVLDERPPSADFYDDYDMKFSADISRQMQMPDRLAAVDGMRQAEGFKLETSHAFTFSSAAFGMTMPERIYIGENDYPVHAAFSLAEGFENDDPEELFEEQRLPPSYVNVTPVKKKENAGLFSAGDLVVPPTPGSMLRDGRTSDSGIVSDWMRIQRNVAKLTCRIERLEEENSRRRQREWLLYPVVVGYCLLQLARLFLGRSK